MEAEHALPVCVRHRDGWCATFKNTLRYSDIVPTVCRQYVMGPFGLERRMPDCLECLVKMGRKEG